MLLHQIRTQFVARLTEGKRGRIECIPMDRVVFQSTGLPELAQGDSARPPFVSRHVPVAAALSKLERRSHGERHTLLRSRARDRQDREIPADASRATPRMVAVDMIDETSRVPNRSPSAVPARPLGDQHVTQQLSQHFANRKAIDSLNGAVAQRGHQRRFVNRDSSERPLENLCHLVVSERIL